MKNLKSKLKLSLCLLILCFSTFAQTDSHECEIAFTRADLERCASFKRQNELLERQIKFQLIESVSLKDTIKARDASIKILKSDLLTETQAKEAAEKFSLIVGVLLLISILILVFRSKIAKLLPFLMLVSVISMAQPDPQYRPPLSLNGQKGLRQTFIYDTTSNSFSIVSVRDTHRIGLPYNRIMSVIGSDTTKIPPLGYYRIALTSDSLIRIINSSGKVYSLENRHQAWALRPIVIDSTVSSYTIVDNRANNFVLASTQNFSNTLLGKYNIYSSNLYYYLPKNIANYTLGINLPNPSLTSSVNLVIHLTMNKKCTINFNYPIYFTLRNGNGLLTTDTDYGLTQMNPTLQTIPTTNYKARWFVSHDSTMYEFYVRNNKWYIN
jgi:hypothetical protein